MRGAFFARFLPFFSARRSLLRRLRWRKRNPLQTRVWRSPVCALA